MGTNPFYTACMKKEFRDSKVLLKIATARDQDYVKKLDSAISKIPKRSQVIITGDFNLPDVNWIMHPVSTRQISCCQ